jgi:DNA topoisomerase-1
MQAFAAALPILRRRTSADLSHPGLPRNKVIAAIVQLLEKSLIRIGNEEYAKQNGSFGLTTLRNRHVRVGRGTLRFQFRGKSGVRHVVDVDDRRLAQVVKQCRDLPGQELFVYVDSRGTVQSIGSGDINDYIREVTGEDFTAKDFRTWSATVLAVTALRELPPASTKGRSEKNVVLAVEAVARLLGNTRAVCRKSYVHPGVVESYIDGRMLKTLTRRSKLPRIAGLRPDEVAVLQILRHVSKKEVARAAA